MPGIFAKLWQIYIVQWVSCRKKSMKGCCQVFFFKVFYNKEMFANRNPTMFVGIEHKLHKQCHVLLLEFLTQNRYVLPWSVFALFINVFKGIGKEMGAALCAVLFGLFRICKSKVSDVYNNNAK